MNNNKKGFTLTELLAVITILGVLLLIAVPAVTSTIESSRKKAMLKLANTYLLSFEQQLANKEYFVDQMYIPTTQYYDSQTKENYHKNETITENMFCEIPPVGFYTVIYLSDISTEGGNNKSPWEFNFLNDYSSVVLINKKTVDTEVGDNIVGKLGYYFSGVDKAGNGIYGYKNKTELKTKVVKTRQELTKDSFKVYNNKVPYKIEIDGFKYQFYQKCKSK